MISTGDDFPIHQTPEPVQQVFTSDRNFYDRFFFNGYLREGEPYFAAAMGIYPNVGIIDAAFNVICRRVQHCVRASRALGDDRLDTKVGPISIEIGQPMRTIRLRVDHPDIKADLEFRSARACDRGAAISRGAMPENNRLMMDLRASRSTADMREADRRRTRLRCGAPRVWGSRDRSWGVRHVGVAGAGRSSR